jgi:hypothetical protein
MSSLKDPSHSAWDDLCCLEEDSVERVGRAYFWPILEEVWKHRSIGGMCETEPKSAKSAKMKRQHICSRGHVLGAL